MPNPSLERTSTGLALGPRTGKCHHPLRGPSTNPVAAAQLKRSANMHLFRKLSLLLVIAVLSGCAAYRFSPGFSMADPEYFSEAPHIVSNQVGFSLRWRYGKMGFFFAPNAKLIDGKLFFTLQATSSSGALAGQYAELPITTPGHIEALKNGGAFWLEPNQSPVQLVVKQSRKLIPAR